MSTFTWYGIDEGGRATALTTGSLGFYSSAGSRITVGAWNARTYLSTVSGSAVTELRNTTSGSTPLPVGVFAVPLRIKFVGPVSVVASAVTLRAFALGEIDPPDGLRILAAEASGSYSGVAASGSNSWSLLSGSLGSCALDIAPRWSAAATHYFHVGVTVSPTAVGKHIGNALQLTVEYY